MDDIQYGTKIKVIAIVGCVVREELCIQEGN